MTSRKETLRIINNCFKFADLQKGQFKADPRKSAHKSNIGGYQIKWCWQPSYCIEWKEFVKFMDAFLPSDITYKHDGSHLIIYRNV